MLSIKKPCSYLILMTIFLLCQNLNAIEHSKVESNIDDSAITAKIKGLFLKEKIFGDKPIDLVGIHVETINGIVHLSGKVDDAKKIKTAIQLASSVKGVKEVKSSLLTNE